jgi:hypothetical protein
MVISGNIAESRMIKDLEFIQVGENKFEVRYKSGEKFDVSRKIISDFHDGKIKKR